MTTTVRTITCPLCFEKAELRRANEWTRTPRYLRQEKRPAFLRYNSRGRTDTYFNDGHDCKGDTGE
jgi:hypothetical protein